MQTIRAEFTFRFSRILQRLLTSHNPAV